MARKKSKAKTAKAKPGKSKNAKKLKYVRIVTTTEAIRWFKKHAPKEIRG